MLEAILIIVITAIITSLLTLALLRWYVETHLQPMLKQMLDDAIEKLQQQAAPEIEERVKRGILEGIKAIPSREILRDTTLTMAKTGLELMGDSFKLATRTRDRPKKPDQE